MLFAASGKPYKPDPVHEVQDHRGFWPFFEHLFDPIHIGIPLWESKTPVLVFGYEWYPKLTKFMVLELIAAALIIAIFVPLARRIRSGDLPAGRWWNLFEGMLVFIRDEIARPNLDAPKHGHSDHGHEADSHGHGHDHPPVEQHEADKYVPFLWTLFLFILFCNLLGLIPMMGSPTASIWVTGGLALISFILLHAVGIIKYGPIRYFVNLWPPLGPVLIPVSLMIFVIELMGTFIKSGVLAVRLFANMFAGHMVLANILLFIFVVGKFAGPGLLWGSVTAASVLGVVALSLLELFVGFLQAYIFTFLTALFMGMSLHAEH